MVLKALSLPPSEPLHLVSMRDLTMKNLFLVSLATARKVNELQALSNKVAWQDFVLALTWVCCQNGDGLKFYFEGVSTMEPHLVGWAGGRRMSCALYGLFLRICIEQNCLLTLDSFSCQLETSRNLFPKLLCWFFSDKLSRWLMSSSWKNSAPCSRYELTT